MSEEKLLIIFCIFNIFIAISTLYMLTWKSLSLLKKNRKQNFNVRLIFFQLHCASINFTLVALLLSTTTLFHHSESFKSATGFQQICLYYGSYSSGFFLISMLVVFIERLLATWFYKYYENFNNRIFMVSIFGSCFVIGAINSYVWNANLNINKVALRYSFLSFQIVSTIATFLLLKKNRQMYMLKYNSNIILSHRYQLHENIQTLKEMFPFVLCGNLGLTTAMITSVLGYAFMPTYMEGKAPPNCYYFGIVNVYVFLCFTYIQWQARSRGQLFSNCFKNPKGINYRSNIVEPLKTCEADEYFRQLKSVWQ